MNWMKQKLADVAGTQEPIYGSSAIQSVTDQMTKYRELSKDDFRWATPDSTCVETQTFYITADSGHIAMAQVIYSNVMGVRVTTQFNSKVIYPDQRPHLWTSDPLSNHGFDEKKYCFHADKCSVNMSEDGDSYKIKSSTNDKCVVDIKFTRAAPGFVVGKDGTSYFGTDSQNPWGSMRHAFWPRCDVEGTFLTKDGPLDLKGKGLYIHALQGMKPHHAAARWNFADFQSPTHSAVLMEFTTPPSYGSTKVTVGGVAKDGKLLFAGPCPPVTHDKTNADADVGWPEPSDITFTWSGKDTEDHDFQATLSGSLGTRTDRVDVMAEVPRFVKQIVANAAGTRPYIYQYTPKPTLKLHSQVGDQSEDGQLFSEATFIS